MPTQCIVKKDNYKVSNFNDVLPNECVLSFSHFTNLIIPRYELVNNVIAELNIIIGERRSSLMGLDFKYNTFILKSIKGINFQSFAEHLNMYYEMSSKELEEVVLKAQEQTKTTLEKEIEDLKTQKEQLEEKVQIYIEIEEKKEELRLLIQSLDS